MKKLPLVSAALAAILAVASPVFAHVGHGDEFQSKGKIQRVQINSETDQQLGIIVTPIAQTAKSAAGVMVPVTSLVEADGKQLVFVQYQNFYEPVEVKTGKTQGENIEVIDGLSVGEKLVTQGSLSLYAQSRKTQKADPVASPSTVASPNAVATAIATPQSTAEHNQAHVKGIAHSDQGVLSQENNLLVGGVVVGGSALALIGGGIFLLKNRQSSRKKLKLNSRSKNQGDV
ncbi:MULTISPECIES: cobalt transporter [Pseudanabaena]|uniref:cobalt transporter n=1 Tax=Pseudanabaena TaxID=1152 RepID=UPI0024789E3A|nr:MULTISPECIES: cobalt transporter [Pseudanabaena]MEA5487595.1 cobalt transporter [Pseudanabaena sp. CCNP1317]WGS75466.1 cobalt transporter [Pseudanabaena galeata CCNP1313]